MKMRLKSDLPDDVEELVHNVIGAAIEVHRHLGPGFLESIYEQGLCHELELRDIVFETQKEIIVPYKKARLTGQRLDMLVAGKIIVELKAIEQLAPIHEAQLMSYMKATGMRIGLLINFNVNILKNGLKRIVF